MYDFDIKIFDLIDILKKMGRFDYDYEFCNQIGMLKQNLAPIKQGKAHFTALQIQNICKAYKVNANWIFGTSPNAFANRKQMLLKDNLPLTLK
jgi:DNA-binding Xre family transcriptional regulator